MHRLATIHNVTDNDDRRQHCIAQVRPLVRSAKNLGYFLNSVGRRMDTESFRKPDKLYDGVKNVEQTWCQAALSSPRAENVLWINVTCYLWSTYLD